MFGDMHVCDWCIRLSVLMEKGQVRYILAHQENNHYHFLLAIL